jgi:23S rRNA (guanosine2251-2'-O)-methyltransferase
MTADPPAANRETPSLPVTVILDSVRSLYNVGSVMRSCDGAGVYRLIACGITPYPHQGRADPRRGPIADRASRELRKTALAAMETVHVEPCATVAAAIARVRAEGATVVAVEATGGATLLWEEPALDAPNVALVFGHEVEGVAPIALAQADATIKIPMLGAGASLNIATAAAVVLYEIVRRRHVAR